MINEQAGTEPVSKVARLQVDNARLRKLAVELEADVRQLRDAVGKTRSRPAVDPAYRLLVVSRGERRARGA